MLTGVFRRLSASVGLPSNGNTFFRYNRASSGVLFPLIVPTRTT